LSFCKTVLQTVLSAKRFASILSFWRFTENYESADYDGGKNIKAGCVALHPPCILKSVTGQNYFFQTNHKKKDFPAYIED